MKLQIKKGSADQSVYVFIQNSSVTTGAGLTGLVFNSASLVAYYVRPLGSATAITLATQTVTGAHADGGFVEVNATNMPGIYRLDLPDAVIATGVNSVVVMLKGATNMPPVTLEIELVAYDPQIAANLGLTNLDAAISSRATPAQVNAEVLDVLAVDTLIDGRTLQSAVRIIAATTAGKLSGSQTASEIFVGLDGVTTRVTVTADSAGNRTTVVYG